MTEEEKNISQANEPDEFDVNSIFDDA